jgi:hypothetical protein
LVIQQQKTCLTSHRKLQIEIVLGKANAFCFDFFEPTFSSTTFDVPSAPHFTVVAPIQSITQTAMI